MVSPNFGGHCAYESQGFVMRTISVVPRVCFARHIHLRSVARNINILEQNALTMKWLQSFWNARVDPVSAIRNVKVHVGYEPFNFSDYIV